MGLKPTARQACLLGAREGTGLFYNYFDTFPVAVVSEFRLKEPRDVVYLAAVHRRPAALSSETLGNTLKPCHTAARKKAFEVEWSRARDG